MWKFFFSSTLVVTLAIASLLTTESTANAETMTQTVGAAFGDDGSGTAQPLLWNTAAFTLPAIDSLDSLGIQLAHPYGSDVELRVVDSLGNTTIVLLGDEAVGAFNGQDDDTQYGDGAGFGAANVFDYTLDPAAATPIMDHTPNAGNVAAGTYNGETSAIAGGTIEWPTGSFPAGSWSVEIWDTWSGNDGGYVGDVSLNYSIPEPSSIAIAFLAMSGVLGLRRRKS